MGSTATAHLSVLPTPVPIDERLALAPAELAAYQHQLLEDFLVSRRATSSASTVSNTRSALRANFFPWLEMRSMYVWQVTPEDLDQWALGLKNSLRTRTHQHYFAHVAQFYDWPVARRGPEIRHRIGMEIQNPVDRFNRARRLGRDERLVPVPREEAITFLLAVSRARIDAASSDLKWLQACRNYALWMVLNWAGLRRMEAAALEHTDVDLVGGILRVREGKGGKGRIVHIQPPLALILRWYLQDVRSQSTCAWQVPLLFLNSRNTAVHPNGIRNLLHRDLVQARMPEEDQFTCHGFRRAYATRLYKALREQRFRDPLVYVKEQLGHAYLSTTQRYCQLDDDYRHFLVRDAADALIRRYADTASNGDERKP